MDIEKNQLYRYAMQYGTCMGLYWIIKFGMLALGPHIPFFFFAFFVLTLGVPFLGYYYARLYRDRVNGGYMSFAHAWLFTFQHFLYASLLVSIVHYLYFRFVGQEILLDYYDQTLIAPLLQSQQADEAELARQLQTLIAQYKQVMPSPIQLVMQQLAQNAFYGSLLALPIALFVRRQPMHPCERPSSNQETQK